MQRKPDKNLASSDEVIASLLEVCSAFFEGRDREALLSHVLDSMIHLTHGDRGTIFLVPEASTSDDRQMTSLVATGLEGKEIRVDIDQGIAGYVFRTGLPLLLNDVRKDERFYAKIDESTGYVTESILSVPLRTLDGKTLGVIEILNSSKGAFQEDDLKMLQALSLFAAIALEHRMTVETLQETNEQLKQIGLSRSSQSWSLSSENPDLRSLYERLAVYAESDSSVLIEGESGTGKEVVAQMIHMKSHRRDRPFVAVNCAAIPESLFEAELFGVAKGAATGTIARKGKVELAHGGTLFLDEIGELPLSAQAKLLRVLQDRAITRVGSEEKPRPVDFRIVAATNRDLAGMVREKTFREDLFYRINVIQFRLPRLAERREDIPMLCQAILNRFLSTRGWKPKRISAEAMKQLVEFSWPGNIRQLQNKLENAMILSRDRNLLEARDFQLDMGTGLGKVLDWPSQRGETLVRGAGYLETLAERVQFNLKDAKDFFEFEWIDLALKKTDGNKSQAARLLGMTREGLRKALLKKEQSQLAETLKSEPSDGHKKAA